MLTKLNVVLTKEGIISQFDGYMGLKELDWEGYRKRFYSIHPHGPASSRRRTIRPTTTRSPSRRTRS